MLVIKGKDYLKNVRFYIIIKEVVRAMISIKNLEFKYRNKEIFNNLRYPKGILFEDVAIILNILFQCKKVVILKDMLYNYLDRQGSIMKSNWNHQKLVSKLFMFEKRLDFLK